jgi:propanol-preferring alcohol dehydrogenase
MDIFVTTPIGANQNNQVNKPLEIEQVPVPTPTGRDLLVRVQVASLCHSDVSVLSGITPSDITGLIPGHEAVSVVEALGPDAGPFGIKPGDRIGTPLWQNMCLECYECKELGQQFCAKKGMIGITKPGFFAEYTLVDAASAVVIPEDVKVSPAELSPVFCAGITVWDAVTRAKLVPGETVAVVGVGGLGEMAIKYAHAHGAKVFALDIRDEQLLAVKSDGLADEIVNMCGLEPGEVRARIVEMNRGRGVDAVIVTTGAIPAYHAGLAILRPEGRLMVVGIPMEEFPLRLAMLAMSPIRFVCPKLTGDFC